MPAIRPLWLLPLAAITLHATTGQLELDGQIEDATTPVHVRLYGTDSPFTASATSNSHGSFRFRSLKPGTYIVSAFIRRHGEARRTVVVTGSFADVKGIVRITIPLPPPTSSVDRARRRSMVSMSELSIPDSARQKVMESQKDLARRDTEHAIAHLKEAVELAPKYAEAWNSLGVIAYQTRDYPQAEHYFRKALEIDPGNWTPALNLGGVLLNLNKPKEALDYNRFAAQAHPNDALANSQLGINYFQLDQFDKAEQYLSAAEHLDPSHFSQPQLMLARIYARRGDKEATLRELKDFVSRFPDSPTAAEIRKNLAQFDDTRR
jgi:Flp pilus assembly protein TadD